MEDEHEIEEEGKRGWLYRLILRQRYDYLCVCRIIGYEVEEEDLEELRKELALPPPGQELTQVDVDQLQQLLGLVDARDDESLQLLKASLYRKEYTVVRMRPEQNHGRPHFHVEYKQEHSASYAIDTFDLLAGSMPKKYEERVLPWALCHQDDLMATWDALQRGEDVRELVLAAEAEAVGQ